MLDSATIAPPAVEEAAGNQPAEKVVFSEAQQKKVEAIVKEVSSRTSRDLQAENEKLRRELEATKASQTPATPDLSRDLELTRGELSALKREREEEKLNAQLRQAAGNTFFDTELAIRVMKDSVRVGSDGRVTVVDAEGNLALNSDFNPMSLTDLATHVANEKKWMARGDVKPGAGSTPGGSPPIRETVKLEHLFGKSSSGAAAANLMRHSPSEYRRLKGLAREKGLLPK